MKLDSDDFELFGVPRRFAQHRAELDSRWRALQAEVHPDRFAAEGAAAQRVAMQWAVRINEAYRRLRNPLSRAAYLCQLHGMDVGAEDNTAMPAAFLMQQMQWRESLAEAPDLAAVDALADEVAATRDATLRTLAAQIDESDPVDWSAVAATVRGLMFVDRFLADIDRRIEALQD